MYRKQSCALWSLRTGLLALLAIPFLSVPLLRAEGTIGQNFQTDEANLTTGALVSLKEAAPNNVELATPDRADRLIGVVGSGSLLELGGDGGVQVVTNGITEALLSDINGTVVAGDNVTASPIEGIGMKADRSVQVVGIAQANLESAQTETRTVTDKDGKQQTVRIGKIPVQVNVTFYAAPNDRSTFLPAFLHDFADSIAGRQVSPVRIIVAMALMLVALASIGILLYASVRSSIISIGRNPLSEGAVRKGLIEVGLVVLGILLLTVITVYLILTT